MKGGNMVSIKIFLRMCFSIIFLYCSLSGVTLYGSETRSASESSDIPELLETAINAAENKDYVQAEKLYNQALEKMDKGSEYFMYENIQTILSEEEQKQWEMFEDKKGVLKSFWLYRDPTPLTPANERLLEHLRRIAYARKNFRGEEPEGKYDDRGRVYIKYGAPTHRMIEPGTMVDQELDYFGSAYGSMSPQRFKSLKKNAQIQIFESESWTYNEIGYKDGLIFEFTNVRGSGFKQIKNLIEAVEYDLSTDRLEQAFVPGWAYVLKMHVNRTGINPGYYGLVAWRSKTMTDFLNNVREFSNKKEEAYRNAPPDAFDYGLNSTLKLPIHWDISAFRGKEGNTRYEFYYSFPLKSVMPLKAGPSSKLQLGEEFVVRKDTRKDLWYNWYDIEISPGAGSSSSDDSYVNQINFEIPPVQYSPAAYLTIENPADSKKKVTLFKVAIRNFTGDSLMVSDIKLSYDLSQSQADDRFTRNGLRIIPYTHKRLNRGKPVHVYFEIYNLRPDPNNNVSCKVQYIVLKRSRNEEEEIRLFDKDGKISDRPFALGPREFISLENEYKGTGSGQIVHNSIDMSSLEGEEFEFIVYVTDQVSQEYAHSRRTIVMPGKK